MKKTRIVGLLLVFVLVTSCFVGGTFAKYASQASGSDTATVAKWSFEVGGTEIATSTETKITVDLFNTIKDSDRVTNETDVVTDKIAPGTSGSFTININNTSDVTADYVVEIASVELNSVPLEFSLDGNSWVTDIDTIKVNGTLASGTNENCDEIHWRWLYSVDTNKDKADTELGIAGNVEATVTIKVTATQVD